MQHFLRCSDIHPTIVHNTAMPNILTELKRRNVFRVGMAYIVVAWLVAQVFDLVTESFAAPDWVMRVVLIALTVGLPIALILAWAFELTPDGVMKSEDVARSGSIASGTGRKLNYLTSTALILALAFIAFDKLGSHGDAGAPVVTDKSVAVLPFADLSEQNDQEWFTDGLTEEILNSLARLPELQVTARTSSFEFKNTNTDISEIASRLGVAHIVEGSVRRIGDKMRVTAQLIRAHDGFHLWSETYDRNTEDLFDVQNDVAENIAASLDVILDDSKRRQMFATGTRNVAAFEAFIKGKNLFNLAHSRREDNPATLEDANKLLELAMQLDPNFGQPAILHSDRFAHTLMEPGATIIGDSSGLDSDTAYAALRRDLKFAAQNAVDPAARVIAEINLEIFAASWYRLPNLIEELKGIVATGATLPDTTVWLSEVLILTGEYDLALTIAKRRQQSDPLVPSGFYDEFDVLIQMKDADAAASVLQHTLSVFGDSAGLRLRMLMHALLTGDKASALSLLQNNHDWSGDFVFLESLLAALQGDRELALQLAEHRESTTPLDDPLILWTFWELGDTDSPRSIVSTIDAMPVGPTLLAVSITTTNYALLFDLDDTPNLKQRLSEAHVNLSAFRLDSKAARQQ